MGISGLGVAKPASAKRLPRPAIGRTMFSMSAWPLGVLVVGCAWDLDHYGDRRLQDLKIHALVGVHRDNVPRLVLRAVHGHAPLDDHGHFGCDLVVVPGVTVARLVRLDGDLGGLRAQHRRVEIADEPALDHFGKSVPLHGYVSTKSTRWPWRGCLVKQANPVSRSDQGRPGCRKNAIGP